MLITLRPDQTKRLRLWLFAMLASAVVAAFSFKHVDLPVAVAVYPLSKHIAGSGAGLGSAVLLTFEAAIFLTVAAIRVTRGKVSPLSKAVAVACVASICAYAINASVLKVFFGVPNPAALFGGARHVATFLGGSPDSSFPSGHMVLAGAFGGVLMRLYPKTILALSGLLLAGAVVLVVGGWHFVSDVVAGTFVGVSAGILAGEIWLAHELAPLGPQGN